MSRPTPQRPAAVLVLALLLMSAIIGSSIALSTVIADSTHQTTALNDFISASLSADSALERGLAFVKVGRVDQSQAATITGINATPAAVPNSTINAQSPSNRTLYWSKLAPRESVSFDYVKSGPLATGDDLMTFTGYAPTTAAKLDISWIGLDTSGRPLFAGRRFVTPITFPAVSPYRFSSSFNLAASGSIYDLDGNPVAAGFNLGATRGFRIRVTAVLPATNDVAGSTVSQLTVTGTNDFPSRVQITGTGTINKSQSQKSVTVPWQLPSSSVFNYVLFSEGDIIPQ